MFILSLNTYILRAYYMPGTVAITGVTVRNEIQNSMLSEAFCSS